MKLKIYIFLFISGIMYSCSGNVNEIIEPFSERVSLVSTDIFSEDVPMRYPFRIRLHDSCLYVMDLHGVDYYCHWFSYPDMEYKGAFASKGMSPGEFYGAENIRLNEKSELWMLDANKMKVSRIHNLKNDIDNPEIKLPGPLIRCLDFDFFNDSLLIIPDYTGKSRFNTVDLQGRITGSCFSIPVGESQKAFPDIALAQAWRPFIDYNPGNGILAAVTQLGDVLEIYNMNENRIVNIVYGKQGEPQFKMSEGYAVPTGIMGYSDVYVGNEHIYTLFWGHSFKDLKKGKILTEGGKYIRVFDLEGNKLREYELDCCITGFCLDEERNLIIGLDVNSDQPLVELRMENKENKHI